MDAKDALHITASLSRLIGQETLIEEMEAIGWRLEKSHPVAFLKGYLGEYKDHPDEQTAIDGIRYDMTRIANLHGFDLNDDEFDNIVPGQ